MRKLIPLLVAAPFLFSCQTAPQVVNDVHTGTKTAMGSSVVAYDGLFDTLHARPFHSSESGYGFRTSYNNYGWIFIREAWSYGLRLNYIKGSDQATMCGGAGGCITIESGVVLLSKEQFENAAKVGFDFKLVGMNGSVTGKIPAKAFADVLKL